MRTPAFSLIFALSTLVALGACGYEIRNDCVECGFYTDASGKKIMHWPEGSQIEFEFNAGFPTDKREAIVAVTTVYTSAFENISLSVDPSRSSAPDYSGSNPDEISESIMNDGVNGIYWVTGEWPWARSNPGSDAMTYVSFKLGQIVEADIFFWAPSFSDSTASRQNPSNKHLSFFEIPKKLEKNSPKNFSVASLFSKLFKTQNLAGTITTPLEVTNSTTSNKWLFVLGVHEFGHALGRIHSDQKRSVMYPSVGLSFVRNPLTEDDLKVFSKAYTLRTPIN
jgi:hypothetical protein